MGTLSEAPLMEAIIEIRWGKHKLEPNKPVVFEFPPEDTDFFPGQFRDVSKSRGFDFHERVNIEFPPLIPHVVKYRFRRAKGLWPCYQIGLGVFTVNQVNEGYDWITFRKDILTGLEMLDKGHPVGLGSLPLIGIEMRYQDGFIFSQNETPSQFLDDKLNIKFGLPEDFFKSTSIQKIVREHNINFSINVSRPEGVLLIKLTEGLINAQPGFIMETTVRSADKSKPTSNIDSIETWLEEAHDIQKYTFKTLINPTYAKSFK